MTLWLLPGREELGEKQPLPWLQHPIAYSGLVPVRAQPMGRCIFWLPFLLMHVLLLPKYLLNVALFSVVDEVYADRDRKAASHHHDVYNNNDKK